MVVFFARRVLEHTYHERREVWYTKRVRVEFLNWH
jgi:hypothetical protein